MYFFMHTVFVLTLETTFYAICSVSTLLLLLLLYPRYLATWNQFFGDAESCLTSTDWE